MLSFLITLTLYATSVLGQTTYSDWQAAKDALTTQKAAWLANGVTSYAYNVEFSAFTLVCYVAPKYVVIDGRSAVSEGTPIYAEFDQEYLAANPWVAQQCDPQQYIYSPLTDNFYTIDYYYDAAIAHAQQGIDANCSTNNRTKIANGGLNGGFENSICGGYIVFDYDATYNHPTFISLQYGPFIADAGRSWTFKCLTSITDDRSIAISRYSGQCTNFTVPALGDDCGTPGVDCPALKCACIDCMDGANGTYGCCGECTLEETLSGELICSGYQSQETSCSYNTCGTIVGLICPSGFECIDDPGDDCELGVDSDCAGICVEGTDTTKTPSTTSSSRSICGTIQGLLCPTDYTCVDDPTDSCDPLNGGSDCGGFCVLPGDDCLDSQCESVRTLAYSAKCFLCPDGLNSYGSCGTCTYEDDGRGGLQCSSTIPRDRVCPITTTETPVTTKSYERCGGRTAIQCSDPDAFCVDDPRDSCDPLTSAITCGGICVSPGDECNKCDSSFRSLAPCGLCNDGSGNTYGNCGLCTYELTPDGKSLTCSTFQPQSRVCPTATTETPCICTKEYLPWCCPDGVTYGNQCVAGCSGWEAKLDCKEGECPTTTTTPKTTRSCCPAEELDASINQNCWERCACCPDGSVVGSIGDGKTFPCPSGTLNLDQTPDLFGEICPTTTSAVTPCCKEEELSFATNPLCREGCACCPDGTVVNSNGDGDTFVCNGVELSLSANPDRFGEVCPSTTTKTPETTRSCCPAIELDGNFNLKCREKCACCPDGTVVGSIGDGDTFICGEQRLKFSETPELFGEICPTTITPTDIIYTTVIDCCDPDMMEFPANEKCREGCACCPDGSIVSSTGNADTFYCNEIQLSLTETPELFGEVCSTTMTPMDTTSMITTAECCDPDMMTFANNRICREGCACCPDGTIVGSIGDADTFYCNGKELKMSETPELFGEVCQETTKSANCICGDIWDPYCCDMMTFGNECEAQCKGYNVTIDCIAGECDMFSSTMTECCDPDMMLVANNPICREGCGCCPDGTIVGSAGDADTFICDGQRLSKRETPELFGDICEQDPCICTREYFPYCCDGTTYSNECEAKCDGYDAPNDCVEGECAISTTVNCDCPDVWRPYCCEDTTYGNECEAKCGGYDAESECDPGECGDDAALQIQCLMAVIFAFAMAVF